jgi:hypothetical protein
LWIRYYEVRKVCQKETKWKRHKFFVNISGSLFTRFFDDINMDLKTGPKERITGMTMRTMTETAGQTLDKDVRAALHEYQNHLPSTARTEYCLPTAAKGQQGYAAANEAQNLQTIQELVLPKIEEFFQTDVGQSFPSKEDAEDILAVKLKLGEMYLSEATYNTLQKTWKGKAMAPLAKFIAGQVRRESPAEFDEMRALRIIREYPCWISDRFEIKNLAKKMFDVSLLHNSA